MGGGEREKATSTRLLYELVAFSWLKSCHSLCRKIANSFQRIFIISKKSLVCVPSTCFSSFLCCLVMSQFPKCVWEWTPYGLHITCIFIIIHSHCTAMVGFITDGKCFKQAIFLRRSHPRIRFRNMRAKMEILKKWNAAHAIKLARHSFALWENCHHTHTWRRQCTQKKEEINKNVVRLEHQMTYFCRVR